MVELRSTNELCVFGLYMLRVKHPFQDPTVGLNPKVNPYVAYFTPGQPQNNTLAILSGSQLRNRAGRWHDYFHARLDKPIERLYVEIGCHFGKTICEMAETHPNCGFVGIDVTFKRVVKTAQKAQRKNLYNVCAVLMDAKHLSMIFGPEELDGVLAFFPDPWTKQRKAKHRLFDADFLTQIKTRLRVGGYFWFRTDQQPYFEAVHDHAKAAAFTPQPRPRDTSPFHLNFETTFERHFRLQKLPIFESIFQKPRNLFIET